MMTFVITGVVALLGVLAILIVLVAFTNSVAIVGWILKRSFQIAISKREKDKVVADTTDFLNQTLKAAAEQIAGSKDSQLQEQLELSKEQTQSFKQAVAKMLKDNRPFITKDDVREEAKLNRSFSFLNLVFNYTFLFSDDRMVAIKKLTDLNKKGLLSDEELADKVIGLRGLSPKQAKAKVVGLQRQLQQDDILPFATDLVRSEKNNIRTVYRVAMG